ncbi:MAG: response regulator transcription factor [Myxococcales bacterium]|nr:response regulator transcription factor [Myxococcales bacterium]MCB9647456.1 response regulator transcription factor [Deltaproteobacteria bacterium]
MKLLVIEDDEKIGAFVAKGMQQEGHVVDWVRDGESGADLLLTEPYDAAIVDLMLPGRDGLSVIRAARANKIDTPIIVLSAKSSVDSRVLGLETGADDYLTKPFSFSELNARLQAILRRRAPAMAAENELTYKDLRLDLKSRKVTRGDATVELAAKEFTLLEYLLRNPERVLSKTMILEHVWGYDFDPQTNVVDVLVHRLRNHVDRGFETTLIQTLRGIGYVLRAE